MDIPQNTDYKTPDSASGNQAAFSEGMLNTAMALGKMRPRKNILQNSQPLQNLAAKTSTYAPSGASMPVSAASMVLPQGFSPKQAVSSLGTETTPYGGSTRYEGFHPGIDVAAPRGTPIPFLSGGRVVETSSGHKQGDKGYGNYVVVQDALGDKVKYSHLDSFDVAPGQEVQAGQKLIRIGNSGQTYSPSGKGDGSHLDLRITDMYGKYMNPYAYFNALEKYQA